MLDHLTEMSNSKKQRVELPLGEVTTEKKFELKSIRSAELQGDTFNCSIKFLIIRSGSLLSTLL